ncbi:sigma 54-interacting transcriptional regulator [Tunturiibacter gelidiferens]|uniref:sigma 54-interacting transcriptional regulator n=1 Tax=Tunturiibacter gelidiferens TaxID=3069689 RepID=UPI003D9B9171
MSATKLAPTTMPPFTSSLHRVRLPLPLLESGTSAKRYDALSRLSHSLVSQSPEDLPCNLSALMRPLLDFDFLDLIVFKEGSSEVLWHSIGTGQFPTLDVPMEETTYWWVYQQKQPLFISDWKLDERFAPRREALKNLGFEYRSLCRLPLRTSSGPIGVLSFVSFRPHNYFEEEMRFLSMVAEQVSLAVASVLHFERSRSAQSELCVMCERLELLQELTNSLVANPNLDDLLTAVVAGARRVIQSDFAILGLVDPESGRLRLNAFELRDETALDRKSVDSLVEVLTAAVLSVGKPSAEKAEDLASTSADGDQNRVVAGFKRSCVLPLVSRDQTLGILAMGRRENTAYTQDEIEFMLFLSRQVAMAVEWAGVYGKLRGLPDNLADERVYRADEIRTEARFEEIVGRSSALQRVLSQVEVVAPTDSGVLITGETGTGKELIARAIHNLSTRRGRPFVKLNCAAIPSGLLESELFGHERGAFTGAVMQKAGRFEAADKGTLFLDEVGDIPLELQPKLLRVLQEGEFERLGSTRTQQVDVRVIAATHRDLKQMIEDGEFRSDLYYRLYVFPLTVPPLRDRREDIPLLVRHYVDKYARRMNRRIETVPSRAMEVMATYSWPGNVRELQNFIERAVILSPGSVLRAPLADLKEAAPQERTRS